MKSFIHSSANIARASGDAAKAVFAAVAMVVLLGSAMTVSGVAISGLVATEASAAVARSISVRGNQRVDADTIKSYLTIEPGRNYTTFDTDESLRQLFATGLFSDVRIAQSGSVLVVEVVENPTINLVRFEGNDKVRDEQLQNIVQSKSLGIFSNDKLVSDTERVKEAVRRSGRAAAQVSSRVEVLDNNRVDIVFLINEGGRTKIDKIDIVGNSAYGDGRLIEVISHNESNFLSWLKRDDVFDPDRLRADEERLRRFYFNRGYADFRIVSAVADLDEEENSYTITITVDEGERYRFGDVNIDNALSQVDDSLLQDSLLVESGDTYSARNIEKTLLAMTEAISANGYPFAEVTPRGERDDASRTINITFFVDEGPRTYIERIEVVGNTRTRGYVIRREFDVSEGDAYNRVLVNKAKGRLEALGFFDVVTITTRPGSAPDRVVVVVNVKDKSTGEISFGGGFSSANGPIGEVSLSERNFLGRGQFVRVVAGFGQDVEKYELSFTEPYFLGRRIRAGFDFTQEFSEADGTITYDVDTSLFKLRANAPITEYLTAGVNYTFKYEDISVDGSPTLSLAIQDSVDRSPFVTSSLGYSFVYNRLDSTNNPRQGIYATFGQQFAGVGGDGQFVSTSGRLTGYYLLSEDFDIVLKGQAAAGNIVPFGGEDLRVTDHFFKGGSDIRGFDDNRGYGPRDIVTNEPVGGLNFWNVTAEVQFPMPLLPRAYGVRGALFFDAGSLFDNDFSDTIGTIDDGADVRASIGGSLLWDSPFGPLRADIGFPIAKTDFDREQLFRFGVSAKF
ncbi:MAG: outer membrane protein assembly factor BamA [Pseudomonadota bacterium]